MYLPLALNETPRSVNNGLAVEVVENLLLQPFDFRGYLCLDSAVCVDQQPLQIRDRELLLKNIE